MHLEQILYSVYTGNEDLCLGMDGINITVHFPQQQRTQLYHK